MGEVPGVKPLFEDTEEIIRYVKRTQIYPIIHIMTIKEETVEKYPDLTAKLIEAFREANRLAAKYFKHGERKAMPKSAMFWATILMPVCLPRPTKRVSRP